MTQRQCNDKAQHQLGKGVLSDEFHHCTGSACLSCGFAAIEAGGALQHMEWFASGPKLGQSSGALTCAKSLVLTDSTAKFGHVLGQKL